MNRLLLLSRAVVVIFILFPYSAFGSGPSDLAKIDKAISDLQPYLGGYPPHVADSKELEAVTRRLDNALKYAREVMEKEPNSAQIMWRLGELYRMAHNANEKMAWNNSERFLKGAISLDPKIIEAHISLGQLYVNTDPKYAKAAENCFITAQKLAGNRVLPDAQSGLFFAYFYQGQFQKAVDEADIFLRARPNDPTMLRLREIAASKCK